MITSQIMVRIRHESNFAKKWFTGVMMKTLNVYALLTTQHKEGNSHSVELQYQIVGWIKKDSRLLVVNLRGVLKRLLVLIAGTGYNTLNN